MGTLNVKDFTDGRMEFEIRRGERNTLVIFKRYQEGDPTPDEVSIRIPTKDFEIFQELVNDPDRVLVEGAFFRDILAPDMKARDWRYTFTYIGHDTALVGAVFTASGVTVPASAIRDLVKILEMRQDESVNRKDLEVRENHQEHS